MLLANFSLFSFFLKSISLSPFICNSGSNLNSKNTQIGKSRFLFQFNSVFFSFTNNINFQFSDSTMKNFLSSAICIEEEKILNFQNEIYYDSISNIEDPFTSIAIKGCRFISVNSRKTDGGAILCFGKLSVRDCLFFSCSSFSYGGAIAVYSSFDINNCDIIECRAYFCSAIFSNSYQNETFYLNNICVLRCCSSAAQGTINKLSPTVMAFSNSNMSLCQSRGLYSSIVMNTGEFLSKYSHFSMNYGTEVNNGICIQHSYGFSIAYNTFFNLTQRQNVFGGSCIVIYNNKGKNGYISNSIFMTFQKDAPSITVNYGNGLNIFECFFFNSISIEMKFVPNLKFYSCNFETQRPIMEVKRNSITFKKNGYHDSLFKKKEQNNHSLILLFLFLLFLIVILLYKIILLFPKIKPKKSLEKFNS